MGRRIIVDSILLIIAFIAPWWVSMLVALVATIIFDNYIEFIILGVILDSLYNAPISRFHNFQFTITFGSGILFLIINYMKTVLRFGR